MPFSPSGHKILLLLLLSYFIILLYVCKEERDRVVLGLEVSAQSNVLQESFALNVNLHCQDLCFKSAV